MFIGLIQAYIVDRNLVLVYLGQQYIGGQWGHAPPFFTAVYTALEIHFCKLLCYSFLLALIYSVYPIIFRLQCILNMFPSESMVKG